MVKKKFLLAPVLTALIGTGVYAQDDGTPQLFSFDTGIAFGYDLNDAVQERTIANGVFGFNYVVANSITAGIKTTFNAANNTPYVGFGLNYSIAKGIGVGLGFGAINTDPALDITLFYDIAQTRKKSANGILQVLKVFLDYAATTKAFGKGMFTIGAAFNFGV